MSTKQLPLVLLLLDFLVCTPCAVAANDYQAVHGLTAPQYQRWAEQMTSRDYRIRYVSVANQGNTPYFSAVAVDNSTPVAWLARAELTAGEFQKINTAQTKRGFRLLSLSGYREGKESHYAATWVRDRRPGTWHWRIGLTERDYEKEVSNQKTQGLRPDCISVHTDAAGNLRFAVLFVETRSTEWETRHGLTDAEYQKTILTWKKKNYAPSNVCSYLTRDGARYAVVLSKIQNSWLARHNLSAATYQTEFTRNYEAGYQLTSLSAHAGGSGPGVEAFDEVVQTFMNERSIPSGAVAVSRNGEFRFAKGYGYRDRSKTQRVTPNTPFRMASLTKPITAAAVRNLIAQKKLSTDTKVFAYLGLKPTGSKPDERLLQITVGHLLEHKGGWDRDKSGDPMFEELKIARSLRKETAPSADDVVRYMTGKPLDFDPGSKVAYSNFGYCLLGRVIEKATGQTYTAYVQKELLAPLGIHSIELGRTLPAQRNKDEPFYADPGKGRNVMHPGSKVLVPMPDGGFHLEAMDAHGGLIGSAVDLTRFLDAYWISGEPRRTGSQDRTHLGSLPGTFSVMVQHPSGYNAAALFNQRPDAVGKKDQVIARQLSEACKRVAATELSYAATWIKD